MSRVKIQERLEKLQAELQGFEAEDLECGDGQDCLIVIVSVLLDLYLATAFCSPEAALDGLDRVVGWLETQATKSLSTQGQLSRRGETRRNIECRVRQQHPSATPTFYQTYTNVIFQVFNCIEFYNFTLTFVGDRHEPDTVCISIMPHYGG